MSGARTAATSATRATRRSQQIDATNFNKLEVAWRFKADNLGPTKEYTFQSTPLMVDGVVYSTAGSRRAVVALDAANGELLWMHRLDEGERGKVAPRQLSGRGLAYWKSGDDARVIYVTPGYQLVALDARTGAPVNGFGTGGIVDLKQNDDQDIDPLNGEIGLHATPVVAKDVIIVGAAHRTGANPKSMRNVKGYVRAFDVRTGKRLWIFHTIPLRWRVRHRELAPRLGRVHRQHRRLGADLGRRGTRDGVPAGRGGDGRLLRREPARRQPVRRDRSSRWISTRASASGTTSSCITGSGTTTSRARRSCST